MKKFEEQLPDPAPRGSVVKPHDPHCRHPRERHSGTGYNRVLLCPDCYREIHDPDPEFILRRCREFDETGNGS